MGVWYNSRLGWPTRGTGRVHNEQSESIVRAKFDTRHQRGKTEGSLRAVWQSRTSKKNQRLCICAFRRPGSCCACHARPRWQRDWLLKYRSEYNISLDDAIASKNSTKITVKVTKLSYKVSRVLNSDNLIISTY